MVVYHCCGQNNDVRLSDTFSLEAFAFWLRYSQRRYIVSGGWAY